MNALVKVVVFALSLASLHVAGQPHANNIGYPTVDAALQALKSNSGNNVSTTPDGWTIVSESGGRTLWSFTPPKHPAHPAVIKRAMVEQSGSIFIEMSALCQASKSACDKLMEEFKELNERVRQSVPVMAATSAAGTDSPIEVEKIDEDSFRLVLKSKRSASVDSGQMELMPKANEVCGARIASLGKFQFEFSEPFDAARGASKTLVLRQEIRCETGDTVTTSSAARSITPQLAPSASQDQRAESETLAYLLFRDSGKHREAYAMMSALQRETISFDQWSGSVSKFIAKAGDVVSRKIKKVTWYRDPPGVLPGNYAAVDFLGAFKNIPYYCGYVVWRDEPEGLRLIREETNIIDAKMVKTLAPEILESLITQFKCR